MAQIKYKKQFRLYDIYRYVSIGEQSHIKGIESYEASIFSGILTIRFCNGSILTKPVRSEKQLKQIIKQVNKSLGNCDKPGPRRYK